MIIKFVLFIFISEKTDNSSEMSTLETLHDRGSRELANFIIDLEDEDCPKFHLHLAAYQGDIEQLTTLLKQDEFKKVNRY